MNNKIKSKTRLAIIQYIFLVLSRKNGDSEKIKEEFDNYFYGKTFSSISDNNEFEISYNKIFFSKLSDNFIKFYKTVDISKNLNNYIDFDREFEKWDLINQAIIISILSELSFTVKEKIKIVLNDYLNVAKNFVPINEVKMINAVVDKYLNDKQIL